MRICLSCKFVTLLCDVRRSISFFLKKKFIYFGEREGQRQGKSKRERRRLLAEWGACRGGLVSGPEIVT